MPTIPSRADEITTSTPGVTVQDALDAGAGGSPDAPLDYLTMIDQVTGDTVVATVESGAWVLTVANRRLTQGGNVRITEDGNVRITE